MTFGKNLQNFRKRNKLSQEKIAELIGSTQNRKQEPLSQSNKERINEKKYYYNETRTKLISYILLVLFLPLNIYFYNNGIYGEVYIELGFLGRHFFEDLLYDIPFIIFIIGGLIKLIKDIKNSENTMVIISKRDKVISYLSFSIVSLITIVIYFKFPPFSSIAMFLSMFIFAYISIFEVIREITKKELE